MLNRGPKVIKVDFEIIHESIWKVGGSLLNYEIGSHQQSSRILGEVSQRSWKFPESLACNLVDVTAFIWINHPNLWGLACKYYSSWWLKDENTCCFQANKRSCCHLTRYFFFFACFFKIASYFSEENGSLDPIWWHPSICMFLLLWLIHLRGKKAIGSAKRKHRALSLHWWLFHALFNG